jgi:hypothetical protein
MTVARAFLFVVLAFLLTLPARATVLVPADLGELSREAQAIVRGRVARLDPRWTDDRGTIETIVTLEVEAYIKGALGATLRFRTPGGDLGRYRSIVVGAPEFAVDEHVVVFLGARGPSVPYVLGLSQGVFRVVPTDGGGWAVTPPLAASRSTSSARIVRGDLARRPLALAAFEERVRELTAGAK